jgi:DNA topoisomerase-2
MRCRTATELNSAAVGGGKTLRERILLLPEDYLGSVQKITRRLGVHAPGAIVPRMVTYVPGLYRIFDEILVYAADNKQRDPSMDHLRVEVDVARCSISIYYNGEGIPMELDKKEGLYAPEMIFGHLSNCDQSVEQISGVKLTNIFSTEFVIESANRNTEKKYTQVRYLVSQGQS